MRGVIILVVVGLVAYGLGGLTWPVVQQMVMPSQAQTQVQAKIRLPADAVKISGCIPFEGEHWVSPKDVAHGPYYVTYNGKVTAIEYMFMPEQIVGEKYAKMSPAQLIGYMQTNNLSFKDLVNEIRSFNFNTLGAQVKYFDIHWTSPHAGEIEPHYDMHLYLQDKVFMDQVCPQSTFQDAIPDSLIQDLIKRQDIPLPKGP